MVLNFPFYRTKSAILCDLDIHPNSSRETTHQNHVPAILNEVEVKSAIQTKIRDMILMGQTKISYSNRHPGNKFEVKSSFFFEMIFCAGSINRCQLFRWILSKVCFFF